MKTILIIVFIFHAIIFGWDLCKLCFTTQWPRVTHTSPTWTIADATINFIICAAIAVVLAVGGPPNIE